VLLLSASRTRGATAEIRPLGPLPPPVNYSPFEGTAVRLDPQPLRPGEPATVIVDAVNRGDTVRTVSVKADVGAAAMLRAVPEGAVLASRPTYPERNALGSAVGVIWKDIVIPPRSIARMRGNVVLRYEYAANPLSVGVTVTDVASGESESANVSAEPVWRPETRPMRWDLMLLALGAGLLLSTVLWPSAFLLWGLSKRPGRKDTVAIQLITAILLAIGTCVSIILVWTWWTDERAAGDYREGRCRITDRMLVYEKRPAHDERPTAFSDTYRYQYRPLVAVELTGEQERRAVISGDSDSFRRIYSNDKAAAAMARFELGREYPCWYSIRDPHELLLEPRGAGMWEGRLVLLGVLSLFAGPGLIAFIRRRRPAQDESRRG
jgi:hypothetical protein